MTVETKQRNTQTQFLPRAPFARSVFHYLAWPVAHYRPIPQAGTSRALPGYKELRVDSRMLCFVAKCNLMHAISLLLSQIPFNKEE